jgi:hypothetical protein
MRLPPSNWMAGVGLFAMGLIGAACGGSAFGGAGAAGAAGQVANGGAESESLAGRAGDAEEGGDGPRGGAAATGGAGGIAAGGGANASDGGTSAGASCADLGGSVFRSHCYLDATVDSESQPEAVDRCRSFGNDAYPHAHLLVLDSAEEQAFLLKAFLVPFTDTSDAWLGLTCDVLAHPDIMDCYCVGCSDELNSAQQSWSWIDGTDSSFGWVNGNPNAPVRCAALGFNAETTIWGWVDRPCDKITSQITGHALHTYRTLCELEP